MRRILPFIILLLFCLPTLAQSGDELVQQARAAEKNGDSTRALTLWSQAAQTFADEGNEAGQGLCLFYQAIWEYKGKDLDGALTTLDRAGAIFSALGRDDGVALVKLQAGSVLAEAKRVPEAELAYQEAVQAARRHGNPERLGEALKRLAEILDTQHRWNEAYDAYRQLMDHQVAQKQTLAAADTLVTLAAIRQLQTRPEDAEAHYKSALQIFQEAGKPKLIAEVMDRLSRLYLSRMDWQKAEKNLWEAIDFHVAHSDQERQAVARANLGFALESQNKFDRATEQYRLSAAVFEKLDDTDQFLQVRRQLVKALVLSADEEAAAQELETLFADEPFRAGELCLELGWSEQAETYFQLALTRADDRSERAKLLNRLGMLAAKRSDLNQARELFTESLSLARDTSNFKLAASVLNNLGENYQSSGRYSAAEPCYLEALEFFRASQDPSGEAYALSNLGTLKFGQGDYDEALKYLRAARNKALDPDTFGGPHRLQGTILNALGLVHQFLGRSDDAERLYLQAMAVRKSVNDERGEIVTLNNIAAMFSESDAPSAAERNYLLALSLSERRNDPSHKAPLYNNLGLVQVQLGREDEARVNYQKALELYRAQGMRDGEAITLDNLGHIADTPQESAECHGRAVSLLEKVGNRQSLATALLNLGEAQADMGNRDAAIDSLKRSVNLLDELALALSPNDKSSFLGKNQEAYRTLVRLLVEDGQTEDAFQINERARARALLDILGGRNVPIRNAPMDLVAQEENLRARIRELLSLPMTRANQDRLSSLKQDYSRFLTDIARLDPGSAQLRTTDIAKNTDLAKALGPDHALLEYFVTERQAYVFIMARGKLSVMEIPLQESELKETLSKWRRSLPLGGDTELATRLGELLVKPALPDLVGIEDLVIVPHRTLHYLPFSALRVSEEPLIEQFQITIAPSASAWLLGQAEGVPNQKFAAAALGNLGLDFRNDSSGNIVRGMEFQPLPGTLDEIEAVTDIFPKGTRLVENDLTVASLQKMAAEAGTLHVATHGVLDPEVPVFSGLVTSDGMITVADVLEWERTPNLVVLSACETALGELGEGDDLVGLTRAFQAGGTRCLVATLWPVSDESTSLWMTSFYQGLKNDLTASQASAFASRTLRQTRKSPYYWAPFVILGDGNVKMDHP